MIYRNVAVAQHRTRCVLAGTFIFALCDLLWSRYLGSFIQVLISGTRGIRTVCSGALYFWILQESMSRDLYYGYSQVESRKNEDGTLRQLHGSISNNPSTSTILGQTILSTVPVPARVLLGLVWPLPAIISITHHSLDGRLGPAIPLPDDLTVSLDSFEKKALECQMWS
jgi:hypothetical protein